MRNRSPGGWVGGGRESRARPLFPVSIRYTRDGVAIRVNIKPHASGVHSKANHEIIKALRTLKDSQAFVTSCNDEIQLLFTVQPKPQPTVLK